MNHQPPYQLSTSNFVLRGNSLTLNIPGNVLVFFKIQTCQSCGVFEPIFKKLAVEDKRVSYAIIDLTYNREVINMSKNTSTFIANVPHLIHYNEGDPYARFKGSKDLNSLKTFITSVLNNPNSSQSYPTQTQAFVPQQNMYGGGGQTQYQPQYPPTVSGIPTQVRNMARDGGQGSTAMHPSMQKQCDPETDDCMMMPNDIIPHNMPWESDFKKYIDTGAI